MIFCYITSKHEKEVETVYKPMFNAKLSSLTENEIINYFNESNSIKEGKDHTREFEQEVVCLIDQNEWDNSKLQVFNTIMDNPAKKVAFRYAAFYALCSYYRRNMLRLEYESILQEAEGAFDLGEWPSYEFLKLMFKAQDEPVDEDFINSVFNLCNDNNRNSTNYGVWHFYGETVANYFESNEVPVDRVRQCHLDEAIGYVERAINNAISDKGTYAKFHCTLGRLKMIKAFYDEDGRSELVSKSKTCFNTAVKYEKSIQRKTEYQLHFQRSQIRYYAAVTNENIKKQEENIKKQEENIKKQEEKMKEDIKSVTVKNFELLSIFSGIVSLLLVGGKMLSERNTWDTIMVMMSYCGSIVILFGIFGKILHTKKEDGLLVACLTCGLIMIILALLGASFRAFL